MITAMNDVDKALFCSLLDYHRTVRMRGIKRVVRGERVAMVAYDDFTYSSCQLHIWTNGKADALNRTFIRECFWYPFVQCKLGLVLAVIQCHNTRALKFVERLGFKRIVTIKDGYALGTDLAIQEMRRENCRWLGVPNGRQSERTRSA